MGKSGVIGVVVLIIIGVIIIGGGVAYFTLDDSGSDAESIDGDETNDVESVGNNSGGEGLSNEKLSGIVNKDTIYLQNVPADELSFNFLSMQNDKKQPFCESFCDACGDDIGKSPTSANAEDSPYGGQCVCEFDQDIDAIDSFKCDRKFVQLLNEETGREDMTDRLGDFASSVAGAEVSIPFTLSFEYNEDKTKKDFDETCELVCGYCGEKYEKDINSVDTNLEGNILICNCHPALGDTLNLDKTKGCFIDILEKVIRY
jgi:hypothetical protein